MSTKASSDMHKEPALAFVPLGSDEWWEGELAGTSEGASGEAVGSALLWNADIRSCLVPLMCIRSGSMDAQKREVVQGFF